MFDGSKYAYFSNRVEYNKLKQLYIKNAYALIGEHYGDEINLNKKVSKYDVNFEKGIEKIRRQLCGEKGKNFVTKSELRKLYISYKTGLLDEDNRFYKLPYKTCEILGSVSKLLSRIDLNTLRPNENITNLVDFFVELQYHSLVEANNRKVDDKYKLKDWPKTIELFNQLTEWYQQTLYE